MFYDPIKDRMGALFSQRPMLQRLFYAGLDMVFLRTWHVKKHIRQTFAQWPANKPLRILDAGTGFGQYAWFLVRTFPQAQILAVDVKDDYLANAKRFMNKTAHAEKVRWKWADLTDFHPEERFDFILSVDVMEHIEDDEAVFRNFAAALDTGGCVLINTPSDIGGSDAEIEGESFISEHVRDGYNLQELHDKLKRAGLEPFRSVYTYGRFGSLAWRLLLKYPMKLLGTSRVFAVFLPVYYLAILPIGLILNALDVSTKNLRGTGVLVLARKNRSGVHEKGF
ncbi:MAG TPA: class I SAM-dependent methyltransferase [Rhodothermales bacterium]|nr:class I SAM-dependent methyltransferase [Rhodothermales bacterium]HRR10141.1 class I SAM-dependent methyltransferase [Rhodothermales bacterium]